MKEDLAQDLKKELLQAMTDCGYTILDVLITDIEPDAAVKHSVCVSSLQIVAPHAHLSLFFIIFCHHFGVIFLHQ